MRREPWRPGLTRTGQRPSLHLWPGGLDCEYFDDGDTGAVVYSAHNGGVTLRSVHRPRDGRLKRVRRGEAIVDELLFVRAIHPVVVGIDQGAVAVVQFHDGIRQFPRDRKRWPT